MTGNFKIILKHLKLKQIDIRQENQSKIKKGFNVKMTTSNV
jgi:hypothetical protein